MTICGTKSEERLRCALCTHFLWKACWHGNTPSSSFTLKSSKQTAHVCCVSDGQDRQTQTLDYIWSAFFLSLNEFDIRCTEGINRMGSNRSYKWHSYPVKIQLLWIPFQNHLHRVWHQKCRWVSLLLHMFSKSFVSFTSLYPNRSLWAWCRSLLRVKRAERKHIFQVFHEYVSVLDDTIPACAVPEWYCKNVRMTDWCTTASSDHVHRRMFSSVSWLETDENIFMSYYNPL